MKYIPKITLNLLLVTLACMAFTAKPAQAEWQLVTDFETETREDFYIWKRFPPGGTLYFDGLDVIDATNRGLYMDPEEPDEGRQNIMHMAFPVPGDGVAAGTDASLKFDFYAYGAAMQFLLGLSDVPITVDDNLDLNFGRLLTPSAWSDYETVTRMRTTFDARDGNQYLLSDVDVPVGEWMTLYQYIDNSSDTFEIYIKTQVDSEPVQLVINGQSEFSFRNGTEGPLTTVFLASTKGTGDAWPDPWVVDNIYVDLEGRNSELPGAIDPGKTDALGLPLVDGWIDTGPWMGFLYADNDPYFWQPDFGTWAHVGVSSVDPEVGTWAFFFYEDAPKFAAWTADVNGWTDTGSFMGQLYFANDTWAYSLKLDQWVTMADPSSSDNGIWTWVSPDVVSVAPEADYEIALAATAPSVDGTIDSGEWDDANSYALTYDALVASGIGTSQEGLTGGAAEAQAHVTATSQGLYLAFEVSDSALYIGNEFGASGAGSDAIQVGIDMNPEPEARVSTVLFDFNPATLEGSTPTGPANIFARWATQTVYPDNPGYDEAWGIEIGSTIQEGTGYTIEVMIPWYFLNTLGFENDLDVGSAFRLTFAVVDKDDQGNPIDILWDAGEGTFAIGNPVPYPTAVITEELNIARADYEIPAATTAPTIDGTVDPGEWDEANGYALTYDALIATGIGSSIEGLTGGAAEAQAFYTATADGLYLGFIVTDADLYISNEFGTGGNASDGIQVGIDMNPMPEARVTTVLFDFNPTTLEGGSPTGPANIFARWASDTAYPDSSGYDASWGIQSAGTVQEGTGYTVEVMIPWTFLNSLGFENDLNLGSMFKLTVAVVDFDASGVRRDILWDAGAGTFAIGNPVPYPVAVISEILQ